MDLFGCKRRDAVALLFAHWKKERYQARGFFAFVRHGIFPSDGLYEVFAFPRPKRHGDFIT